MCKIRTFCILPKGFVGVPRHTCMWHARVVACETSLTMSASGNQGLSDGQHRKERPCIRLQTVV